MTGLREPRIFHVNVNCSNLDDALGFYRGEVGFVPLARTTPEPQPGPLFGLDTVQWDGWILTGAAGIDEVVLDLLEWKIPPPPDRRSYPVPARTGFQRLRLAGGGTDGDSRRSHHCLGPDGLQVEIDRRGSARVTGVDVGCSDVGRTHSFYTDVVGLAVVGDATLSDSRGPEVFSLELVGTKQVPPRAPYELGIYRLAFLTDDIDRDHSELVRAGVTPYSPPVSVDLGPGLPAVRALCFADPDGATLELIEQPT